MEIKGFLKTSFIDYPGEVSAVIWTPGCNFRCPFCYNTDLVLNPASLPSYQEEEILNHLNKEKKFLDGLVITGGEPFLQKDLPDFIRKVKKKNFLVKIDTNGSFPELLRNLTGQNLVDFVSLDIKAPLEEEKYCLAAGLGTKEVQDTLANVIQTIDLLLALTVEYELRTTVAPGILTEEDFLKIGRFVKGRSKEGVLPKRYAIQNFFPAPTINPEFSTKEPWLPERIKGLKEKLQPFFQEVLIRSR
ncbi:MAG: anaerobic ribonucleoside-triphosphate reductase activating protein [Candidatus Omnitrophota bacterium]